jgi:hypothetical protein
MHLNQVTNCWRWEWLFNTWIIFWLSFDYKRYLCNIDAGGKQSETLFKEVFEGGLRGLF